MSYAIGLTEPRLIFGDQRRLERLEGQDIRGAEVLSFEDHFLALESCDEQLPDVVVDEDDPAFILFTSGTTGRPKGAMLSHRNCVHFGQALLLGGAETALRLATDGAPPDPPDPGCVISSSPVFHTSGLNGQVIAGAFSGMTTVFPPPGKWREDLHLELTERYSATMWSLVPTQLWRLLERPDLDRYELSSLRRVSGGGAVWPPEILRALAERLPWVFRHVGYGMTESTAMGTGLRGEATFEHPDSIGQPGPTVEIEVRDSARSALGEGLRGEICIRSAGNFLGYWKNPEATKQVLDDSGWYHTGDYGYHRGGLLYLDGRRSDLIIRGGENVYPAEIENRLIEHPEIMEAAVIGSPHHILGQEVHAYVVPRPGSGLSEEDIRAWAAETLSAFKVPARVELVQELPHNAAGKVLRRFLENPGGIGDMVPD
jgi:acyl-CoA synthetase (AMP-forming)/AMP-acid ligase II